MKRLSTFIITILLYTTLSFTQTILTSGDIAVVYAAADGSERFGLVLLVDITMGTVFYVTDNGTNDNGGTLQDIAGNGEGHLRFTADAAITAGTVIDWTVGTSDSRWSVASSGFDYSTSGDQIMVYQDENPSNAIDPWLEPSFVFSAFFDGTSWDATCSCTSTQSEEPSSGITFAFGNNATTEFDNNSYTGPLDFSGEANPKAAALAAITSTANWSGGNATGSQDANITAVQAGFALLPVEFISFEAKANKKQVLLDWETATELNNEKFVVEHSQDGKNFQAIGEVKGNGTTQEIQQYTFLHEKHSLGFIYYRLKQMDFDGYFEYSKVVTAALTSGATDFSDFYPNPTRNGDARIDVLAENDGKWSFRIYSLSGQLLQQQQSTLNAGQNSLSFDFSFLNSGLYIVHLENEEQHLVRKLTIQ